MKKRDGFVSNSSSSSFICCICGDSGVLPDSCGLDDIGAYECEDCGERYCTDHLIPKDQVEAYEDNARCPICQFKAITIECLEDYKKALLGKTDKELKAEIFSRFKDESEFHSFLRSNK